MTNQDEIWEKQMTKEMENSELTDLQKLEIAQKVKNAKNILQNSTTENEMESQIENDKKELEISDSWATKENTNSQQNLPNLTQKTDEKIENKIQNETKILPELELSELENSKNKLNLSKSQSDNSENFQENIKINFQVSHIYIFIFIGICTIIVNIALWNLVFEFLNFFQSFLYLFDALMANLNWNFLSLNTLYFELINSNFFRSILVIIFVYLNYKIHTKFLTKIFRDLEIK